MDQYAMLSQSAGVLQSGGMQTSSTNGPTAGGGLDESFDGFVERYLQQVQGGAQDVVRQNGQTMMDADSANLHNLSALQNMLRSNQVGPNAMGSVNPASGLYGANGGLGNLGLNSLSRPSSQLNQGMRPNSNESGTTSANLNPNLGLSNLGNTGAINLGSFQLQTVQGSGWGTGPGGNNSANTNALQQQLGQLGFLSSQNNRPVTHPPTLAAASLAGYGQQQPQQQQGLQLQQHAQLQPQQGWGMSARPQTMAVDPSWQFNKQDTNAILQSLLQSKAQGGPGANLASLNGFARQQQQHQQQQNLGGVSAMGAGQQGTPTLSSLGAVGCGSSLPVVLTSVTSMGKELQGGMGGMGGVARPDSNTAMTNMNGFNSVVPIKLEHKSSEHDMSSDPDDDALGENSSGRARNRGMNSQQRQLTVQEKNRSAQRRFRQRQKEKMAFLEKRVEALTKQLDGLGGENDSLKNLNNILEKVLNLRDEHISNLQEAAKVFNQPLPAEETMGGTSASPDGAASPHMLPASIAASPARFSVETIKSMTFDDVLDCWKENLKELSKFVVMAEGQNVENAVVAKIMEIMGGMAEMCHKVAIIQPLHMKRLLCSNLETRQTAAAVTQEHWLRVVYSLGLAEQQRKDILGARSRLLAKLEVIYAERRQIVQLVLSCIPNNIVYTEVTAASLSGHEALDKLRANLAREHNANMEFTVFVYKNILDLVQLAKASVHAYPYYPDPLAISHVLAQLSQGSLQGADPMLTAALQQQQQQQQQGVGQAPQQQQTSSQQ